MPRTPQGAEDVSKYPNVFEALLDIGWTEGDLIKLAGANIMRVLKSAEQV
jgi:membrane dipeptidase